jgi:tetratricopeptide (TPR) repeat protein
MTIQKAETGEQIGTEYVEGPDVGSLTGMVDELTRKIKMNFGLTAEDLASDIDDELADMTTSSLEAWKFFMEAEKYFDKSDYEKCIPLYLKAIENDPKFASAYGMLAWAYRNSGNRLDAQKYAQKAYDLIDSVSEREGYWIRVTYYRQFGQNDKAVEELEELLAIYPDDSSRIDLAILYETRGDWYKAIEHYEYMLGKSHWKGLYRNLISTYRNVGLYEKAAEVLDLYLEKVPDPDEKWVHLQLAQLHAYKGRLIEAFKELDKAIPEGPKDIHYLLDKGTYYLIAGDAERAEENFRGLLQREEKEAQHIGNAWMSRVHLIKGQFQKALDNYAQALAIAKSVGDKSIERGAYQRSGYILMRMGDFNKALEENERAGPGSNYGIFKVKYLAALERFEEAERFAEETKAHFEKAWNKKNMRVYYLMMGFIEIRKEKFPEAIDYLEQAKALMPGENASSGLYLEPLAYAYYKDGQLDEAQKVCETIAGFIQGKSPYSDIWSRSYYMLGKIHEQKGEKELAIENYERFLELWKDADPGLPELNDAKKRLAQLKN